MVACRYSWLFKNGMQQGISRTTPVDGSIRATLKLWLLYNPGASRLPVGSEALRSDFREDSTVPMWYPDFFLLFLSTDEINRGLVGVVGSVRRRFHRPITSTMTFWLSMFRTMGY